MRKKITVDVQRESLLFKELYLALASEEQSENTDPNLILGLKAELDCKFSILYTALRGGLYKFVWKKLSFTRMTNFLVEYTEEILTETFMSAYNNIGQFKEEYKFTTWIYAIAKIEAYKLINKELNKNKEMTFSELMLNFESDTDGDDLTSRFLENVRDEYYNVSISYDEIDDSDSKKYDDILEHKYKIALECIEELPDKYKTIIKDKYILDIQQKDLEKIYGINLNTIKTRDRKAKSDLNVLYRNRVKAVYR